MSNIDWLIVGLSILGAIAIVAVVVGIARLIWLVFRETDDPDELPAPPFVHPKIIGPDLAVARAACEAGYISNKEYVDRVAEAQADSFALDLSALTQSTLQRPRIRHSPDWNGAA